MRRLWHGRKSNKGRLLLSERGNGLECPVGPGDKVAYGAGEDAADVDEEEVRAIL
jgi:hypothetical protein